MKEIKFNINSYVKVKLTKKGHELVKEHNKELKNQFPNIDVLMEVEEDENGYSKWQLWALMKIFGKEIYLGCEPPFETEIYLSVKEEEK